MLGLILASSIVVGSALVQSDKPATIALTIDGQQQFIETTSAERLYEAIELKQQAGTATGEDNKLHAALTVALGTLPDERRILQMAESLSRTEQRRWMREALQNPKKQ